MTALKQPARSAPAPMTSRRRAQVYGLIILRPLGEGVWEVCDADDPLAQPFGGTARQRRQWQRMS